MLTIAWLRNPKKLVTVLTALGAVIALQGPAVARDSCPPGLQVRTPEEVLESHRAALAVGDLDAAMCNYAADATVLSDGGIDNEPEHIRSSLAFFLAIFGGTQPQVVQEIDISVLDPRTHLVRVLYTIDTECIIVPDGIDTYLIRNGQIHGQTSHGFPVFQCF